MTESNMTLASFNVDKEAWEQFKALAKGGGWSASYGLNELIKQALHRQSISPIDSESVSMPDPDLSGYISKADFDKAIAALSSDLEKKSQPDPTAATELIKGMVDEAIANFPKSEPVDIEGQVSKSIETAIAPLNDQILELMEEVDALKKLEPVG